MKVTKHPLNSNAWHRRVAGPANNELCYVFETNGHLKRRLLSRRDCESRVLAFSTMSIRVPTTSVFSKDTDRPCRARLNDGLDGFRACMYSSQNRQRLITQFSTYTMPLHASLMRISKMDSNPAQQRTKATSECFSSQPK